jgi:epoxyqueuosine reductase
VDLFAWDEATFLKNTEGGPIRRIDHERWLRNIAVALGNALRDADEAQAAELRAALLSRAHHESAMVREHVAWALAQRPSPATISGDVFCSAAAGRPD